MNEVCIVIDVLFLICVLVGWKQGLFRAVLSVAGLLASMMISVYAAPYLSNYLAENTQWDEKLAAYLSEQMSFSDAGEEASRGVQVAVIQQLPLPDSLKSSILDNNNAEMYNLLEVTGVYDYIAKTVAMVAINAASFFILVVFLRVAMRMLSRFLGGFTRLPIVKSIDKIGGSMLGAIKGLLFLWLFFLVLSVTSTMSWSQMLLAQIQQSAWLTWLYDNNILLDIVGDLTKIVFLSQ